MGNEIIIIIIILIVMIILKIHHHSSCIIIHSFIHMPPWGVNQGGHSRGSMLHVSAVRECLQCVQSRISVSCAEVHVDDDLLRAWRIIARQLSLGEAWTYHTRGTVQR